MLGYLSERLKTCLRIGLPVVALAMTFQNCGGPNDPSMFGKNPVLPPQGGVENYFLFPRMAISTVDTTENILVVGGECAADNSVSNYIEFQLFSLEGNPLYAPNQAMRVRDDASCRVASPGSQCFKFIQSRCEHGRFYAHIPVVSSVAASPMGVFYNLTAQLVTIDQNGVESRDRYAPQSLRVEILSPN